MSPPPPPRRSSRPLAGYRSAPIHLVLIGLAVALLGLGPNGWRTDRPSPGNPGNVELFAWAPEPRPEPDPRVGPTPEAAATIPTTVPPDSGFHAALVIEPHQLQTTTTAPPPTTAAPTTPTTAAPPPPPPATTPATPPPAPAAAATAAPVGTVHDVASPADWQAAVARAAPGDTIRLVSTIRAPLRYRGPRTDGDETKGVDGAPGRPITITAAEGVWIDPGNHYNLLPGLDILGAAHVHVIGVRVRNSQFGIRLLNSSGSPDAPIQVRANRVTEIGHAGIHVAGALDDHAPSSHVRVVGNHITNTGRTAPEFGEGVYLGYGTTEWVDRSHHLVVAGNRISHTTAEAVDIKPGTRNVTVSGNLIHDLSPIRGGAISAHYVGIRPNPDPAAAGNIVIRDNRIWNVNLDGRAGSNDWAIWVGHGGVTIKGNAIWGMRNDPGRTRAIRIRALQDFGPHPIEIVDNLLWTAHGWMAEGEPSGAALVRSSGNQGPPGAAGVEVPLQPHPSAPPLGAGGNADSGGGPGTALGFSR